MGGQRGSTGHDDKQDSPRTAGAVEIKIRRGLPRHQKQLLVKSKLVANDQGEPAVSYK